MKNMLWCLIVSTTSSKEFLVTLEVTHFERLVLEEEEANGTTLRVTSYPAGQEPHYLEVPSLHGEVVIGDLVLSLQEFCRITEHVLTATPLSRYGDPREELVAFIRGLDPRFSEGDQSGPRLVHSSY